MLWRFGQVTLVVLRLDRLGRSLRNLVQIVAELEKRSLHFESLTEKIERVGVEQATISCARCPSRV